MNNSDIAIKLRGAKRNNQQDLNLSGKNIDCLPSDLYKITSLVSLNLSNNKLTEIDKQIDNLKNLKELDLSANNFIDLPIEIISLPNLNTLNLKDNPIINCIPDYSIKNWRNPLKNYLVNKIKNSNNGLPQNEIKASFNEDMLSTKRNWMENNDLNVNLNVSKQSSFSNTNSNFTSTITVGKFQKTDSNELESKILELENQLQKETQQVKRLKNDNDRLVKMMQDSNNNNNISTTGNSSNSVIKSKQYYLKIQISEK
jgi:Leucine-rich repeat (LRR) protein